MRPHFIGRALAKRDVDDLAKALRPQAFGGSDPAAAMLSALLDLTLQDIRQLMDWADGWLDEWAKKCKPDDDYYKAMRALGVCSECGDRLADFRAAYAPTNPPMAIDAA